MSGFLVDFINNYEYNIHTDFKGDNTRVALQWSEVPPTEPGWYWAEPQNLYWFLDEHFVIVRVYRDELRDDRPLVVSWLDYSVDLSSFAMWLGPLPVPTKDGE